MQVKEFKLEMRRISLERNQSPVCLPMDEIDRRSFHASGSPFSGILPQIIVNRQCIKASWEIQEISLNGLWQLIPAIGTDPAGIDWSQSIPASVPGSVHTALFHAGRIPDPSVGVNQTLARQESYRGWIFRRTFQKPTGIHKRFRLVFLGVCNKCAVWLNGSLLGGHEGMFGGPEYEVTDYLLPDNELVVCIDPIPFMEDDRYPENNGSWKYTVVINNVYGWHYSNMPSLGIWRSVKLVSLSQVELLDPFIATKQLDPVQMALQVDLRGPASGFEGELSTTITPANFDGEGYSFNHSIKSDGGCFSFKASFEMPGAKLWWPVDMGEPCLYTLSLSFRMSGLQDEPSENGCVFGVRTVEMAPLPGGPSPELYNWTFIINGKKSFIKGTGWCTADAMLDFSRERLERFLTLARNQHCQMVRAWGSGMPETDEFYDLCDRCGLMVMQEWPTAWNSHLTQPYNILADTVRSNTLRIRNHPSLVMWGGGNESDNPYGDAIDMMGRLAIELDGTRPFHRGEPWGGSAHDYICYWQYAPLDHNLTMTSRFYGEFGLACMPSYESVLQYLPDEDRMIWPMETNDSLRYHTPIFGYADDVNRQLQYARYFVNDEATLAEIITGSQLSQVVGVRHTLERARTRWPDCSGALYYKLNDNFPAASWSCVDWYGAPKMSHYFFQDAFAPLASCVIFDTVNSHGTHLDLPIFLLDDADALADDLWEVIVQAYDRKLSLIRRETFSGKGKIVSPACVGRLVLTADETCTAPLLVTSDIRVGNMLAHRNFYFINYEYDKGCLFRLPRASLRLKVDKAAGTAAISNMGSIPAVAVNIHCPGRLKEFTISDNFFWLNAGESQTVQVNITDGLAVNAWNSI
jgi:beta-mannosidase